MKISETKYPALRPKTFITSKVEGDLLFSQPGTINWNVEKMIKKIACFISGFLLSNRLRASYVDGLTAVPLPTAKRRSLRMEY